MNKVVVDASVILKLSLAKKETDIDLAQRLFEQIVNKQVKALAPLFLLIECTNILITKKGFSPRRATFLINEIKDSGIKFQPLSVDNITGIISMMRKHDVSAYDGLYVLLAQQEKCRLLTDDRKLLKLKNSISLQDYFKVN